MIQKKLSKKQIKQRNETNAKNREKAVRLFCRTKNMKNVCRIYQCNERSVWRWKAKYNGTWQSLLDLPRTPKTPHPRSHTTTEKKHILDLLRRKPDIGLNELYGKLKEKYNYTRNPASLHRMLIKLGFRRIGKKYIHRHNKPYDTPLNLGTKWQLDVKYVPRECMCKAFADSTTWVYQYTVIDETSRQRFIRTYHEQCGKNTINFIMHAIAFFGYKPLTIQTDNGSEFTYTITPTDNHLHEFTKFCIDNNIIHKTIRPRTPRHNGKVERSHRNDNERFYNAANKFYSFSDLQHQMTAYLERSNNIVSSVLFPIDGKRKDWQSPNQKRAELISLGRIAEHIEYFGQTKIIYDGMTYLLGKTIRQINRKYNQSKNDSPQCNSIS